MTTMLLYGFPLSGNTHKVRLLLAALKLRYEERPVDLPTGAHKHPDFLAKSPRGQIPVLVDGDVTLHDGHAILVYLARRYDPTGTWLPEAPADTARVVGWLSFAANELQNGVHAARVHHLLGAPIPLAYAVDIAQRSLAVLDAHLADRTYLELERPTLADLACYPLVGLAADGKIGLADYPNVRRWVARVQALPGYVAMPGLEARA
jgi:glutathione S-transferase